MTIFKNKETDMDQRILIDVKEIDRDGDGGRKYSCDIWLRMGRGSVASIWLESGAHGTKAKARDQAKKNMAQLVRDIENVRDSLE